MAFDLDGPGGRYCTWEKRCHRSNFTLLKVDFWHGTFAHQCWDPTCKAKYQRLWNSHDYKLPEALQHYQDLFTDPEEFDPHLEDFLVATDGMNVQNDHADFPKEVSSGVQGSGPIIACAPTAPVATTGALPNCRRVLL